MSKIMVGKSYQFNCSRSSLPLYLAHHRQMVTVKHGRWPGVWLVQAKDGWQGVAFEDELS